MSERTSTSADTHPSSLASIINIFAIILSLAMVIIVVADIDTPARIWMAVVLFAFGPGSGIVQFFKIPDPTMQLGMIIGLSAAVDLLVGQSLLWVHNLDGSAAVCLLAGITMIRPLPLPSLIQKQDTDDHHHVRNTVTSATANETESSEASK